MDRYTGGAVSAALSNDVSHARAQIEAFLAAREWRGDIDAVLIAVHEALTNADRHGGGIRDVVIAVTGDELVLEVADSGKAFDPEPYTAHRPPLDVERGRGLWLIDQITDRFEISEEPGGSRTVLVFTPGVRGADRAADGGVAPRPAPARPTVGEVGGQLLHGLGAAVYLVDDELVVWDAQGPFLELFGVSPEEMVGADARGVLARFKTVFCEPARYEGRMLDLYAHPTEVAQDLLLLRDGRVVRRYTAPLTHGGKAIGRLIAYFPVAEETQLVADMQRTLLPGLPDWPELDIGAIYHPAQAGVFVGGDFFDFVELSAGGRCFVVGDVSGRGAAAAAASTGVRAYLRAALRSQGVAGAIPDLARTLAGDFPDEQFVTLALCAQESATVWTLTNCGHEAALLLRDGVVTEITATGMLLGIAADGEWAREPFVTRPGDVLLLYTDGVVDAGHADQRFGMDRLKTALRDLGALGAQELVEAIDARVHSHATDIGDDHVLLAVRST